MTNSISKKMALAAIDALEDKKAEDIRVIDISEVSPLADYFIIANGTNRNQVQALADNVEELLGRLGYESKAMTAQTGSCLILKTLSFMFLIRKAEAFMIWNVSGETAKKSQKKS